MFKAWACLILVKVITLIQIECVSRYPILIIISFDGFRYDYYKRISTPNIDFLMSLGTSTPYVRNVFTTKTYPNHHSIATGVYPEVHGVVDNGVFDPVNKKILEVDDAEFWTYNNEVIPIWILNEETSTDRHSGVLMWPGGEFKYRGRYPTYVMPWVATYPWYQRINLLLKWITDPLRPANLVMMYFEEPDETGHAYGPESHHVDEVIKKVDKTCGHLWKQLLKYNLTKTAHVFITSDHGMETVTAKSVINLRDMIENHPFIAVETSPVLNLWVDDEVTNVVYNNLKEGARHNNYTVYRKKEIPDRWHIKHNRRVAPILVVANEGHVFEGLRDIENDLILRSSPGVYGIHGYDNNEPNMHPFFFAWGLHIKENNSIPPFDFVDLYLVFCRILQITKAPNTDGNFENVKDMMSS